MRAIEERFYGRTARVFLVGQVQPDQVAMMTNVLSVAATESVPAHLADDLRAVHRHVRIPRERAAAFWERVIALTHDFSALPRGGDTSYAFVAGLYPADHPALPEAGEQA